MSDTGAAVRSVSRDAAHRFSKGVSAEIRLIAGRGVEGDAHAGVTVQHLSRVKADPGKPNLRQVHLIHSELFDDVAADGFTVAPGELGENITTSGINLLDLPRGTVLQLGGSARVEITGLRNPCAQINRFATGLLKVVTERHPDGHIVRKAGVMGIVLDGGAVRAGDTITVTLPAYPHVPLEPV